MKPETYMGIDMPGRIAALPKDAKGRPVPAFVAWIDGVPDFRVVDSAYMEKAYNKHLCWVCGQKLGQFMAFVVGPMCALNKTTSELPSHKDCALFSVQACPFLTTPQMHRRERDLPKDYQNPAGLFITRNPAVSLIWITKGYKPFSDGQNGVLFQMGPYEELLWFKEGRKARRDEILESINSGFPILRQAAEEDGPKGLAELDRRLEWLLGIITA